MKKILVGIIAIIISAVFAVSTPVFAECPPGTVPVSILGNKDNTVTGSNGEKCLQDDKGSSITYVLNLIVDIMTIGIGVLGVIGILIVGTQYLTAGDSEEKTRKAKRRLFEIVIGLIAYAIFYAILDWLGVANS